MLDFGNLNHVLMHHPFTVALRNLPLRGFIVGGFLRDALLGLTPGDLDVVLEGEFAEAAALVSSAFSREAFVLGDRFQTRRIQLPAGTVDLSPLQGRRPEEDLLRRDFTINALGLPLKRPDGRVDVDSLLDPARGLEDLELRRIVAVSELNLVEDPLRILRAFRLMVQIGFEIEDTTEQLLELHAEKLPSAAAERVREELMLLLRHPAAHRGLTAMDRVGVLTAVFPEIEAMRHLEQNGFHHLPVLAHSLEAIKEFEEILAGGKGLADEVRENALREMHELVSPPATKAALTKLALLLHDLGKPRTATVQDDGRMTFYGHQSVSRELAEPVLQRLRLSRREQELVGLLIEEHLRVGFYCNQPPVSQKLIFRFHRKLGEATTMSCLHALADAYATGGPAAGPEFWQVHEEVVNAILWHRYFARETIAPQPLLTGEEILAATGLSPGPLIGELKEALLEAQVDGLVQTADEARELMRRLAAEKQQTL